jgi:citrate synthase
MPAGTLTITDNRTGEEPSIAIEDGAIRARDLRQIKVSEDDFGLMSYDPAFENTASCRSEVTYIDGEKGILRYRGYPIEQLAESSSCLETAYLIIHGELPNQDQMENWTQSVTTHTMLHDNIKNFIEGFRYDAHPMGIVISTLAALSTFYPDSKDISDEESRAI